MTATNVDIIQQGVVLDMTKVLNAKQKWEVKEAIEWVTKPAGCKPSWTKKPTFPDEDMHFQMGYATISRLGDLRLYFNNTTVTPVSMEA